MLVEARKSKFNIGDAVKVRLTGQIGTIVAVEGGVYKIELAIGGKITESDGNLDRRQVLMENTMGGPLKTLDMPDRLP